MEGVTSIAFDLLSFSAITVLVVMGLGIIASMMGIFNFAHGEFLLLGAYTVYLTHALGYPVWLGMLLAPLAVALVGFLLERGVIRFFYTDPVVAMLGTYAIGLVIRGERARPRRRLVPLGPRARRRLVQPGRHRGVQVARHHHRGDRRGHGGRLARPDPDAAGPADPRRARKSRRSRAPPACPPARIYALTFTAGAALAGLAGGLVVPLFSMFADLGVRFLIQSFLAVLLGGVGTFEGRRWGPG